MSGSPTSRWRGASSAFSGMAEDASILIPLVERAPEFKQARFHAPSTPHDRPRPGRRRARGGAVRPACRAQSNGGPSTVIDRLLPSQRRLLALAILGVLVLAIAAIVWFPLAYLQQLDLSAGRGLDAISPDCRRECRRAKTCWRRCGKARRFAGHEAGAAARQHPGRGGSAIAGRSRRRGGGHGRRGHDRADFGTRGR